MIVTYYGHSGFGVDTGERVLLFDYIGGGFTAGGRNVTAFVSHAHGDHCVPSLLKGIDTVYAGFDVDEGLGYRNMRPGDEERNRGLYVKAFRSTDEGVSFYVEADGWRIFHAGDLNDWHWRSDGDAEWTRDMRVKYDAALRELEGTAIDIAFFPVDERMGEGYAEGAEEFLRRIKPRLMIPMHFTDKETAVAFAKEHADVRAMTAPGGILRMDNMP